MHRSTIALLALLSICTGAQAADMPVLKSAPPLPPPGPQYFLWVEGGYSHLDLHKLHAFDIGDPFRPVYFGIDDGWYGRGEAGFVPAQRLGWIDAISVAVGYRKGSSDVGGSFAVTGLSFASSTTTTTFSRSPGVGSADQDFALLDIQLRLKHAPAAWPGFMIGVEPFYARLDHDASSTIDLVDGGVAVTRFARLDGDIFGVQAAIEGRRQVAANATLRGRLSLGGYRVNADAHLGETFFGSSTSLSRNLTGVRAGAEVGVDFALSPNVTLGVTGGIDHWSKMPFTHLSVHGPAPDPVRIDSDSFTDFFVGARLTFATGAR